MCIIGLTIRLTERRAVRTKKASKTARIQIKIEPEKKAIFDKLLSDNNESKTEILLMCIDRYIEERK